MELGITKDRENKDISTNCIKYLNFFIGIKNFKYINYNML